MPHVLHVDRLVAETRGARFLTKLDLAMTHMQFRIREVDQYKTSFPGGQYEFRVGTFGLHGMGPTSAAPAQRVEALLLGRRLHKLNPGAAGGQCGTETAKKA